MTTLDAPLVYATRTRTSSHSAGALWAGRALSGLAVVFLTWDAGVKLVRHPMAVAGTAELGYRPDSLPMIGTIALVCLALYVIPPTAILGAVLWTGYLGGAIATHLRVSNPLFTHTLFPLYIALLLWGGLALRDPRVLVFFGFTRGRER
ncbi:MAG TPA: DoxX family protein [Polyangiaceae bacterium]|nr:DoxX family protein [Polyangiaceae bacterium]